MLLNADQSALLVIDMQERLAPAVAAGEAAIARTAVLLTAARQLSVPVLASEQYPKGLGPLVPALAGMLEPAERIEKTHFSCLGEAGFAARMEGLHRRQVVVTGMEAHVCVLQTVLDLCSLGFEVFVVADAVASRTDESRALALARMRDEGAEVVSSEMVIFEWLKRADRPEFRPLSALIR